MSIIIPANSAVGGGYDVDNSCRFNSASTDYLNHTNGTPTSDKKYTFSTWVKRSKLLHRGQFLRVINPSSTAYYTFLEFTDDDRVGFNDYNGASANFQTNRLFRDTSAWYHFVVAMDTTQGTDSNRVKFYVNGVQETSFETGPVYPALNRTIIATSSGRDVNIGGDPVGSGATRKIDGYMAETVLIDGQQLDPTSFGEFDEDSGIWKPISVSGLTFGNNGFYLDFKDSSALGNDAAGSNNFTVNNLTAIDQSTDTCTNNFATLNPLNNRATLTQGSLQMLTGGSGQFGSSSTIQVSQGKWFCELKYVSETGAKEAIFGITSAASENNRTNNNYTSPYAYGYYTDNGSIYNNNGATSYGSSVSIGDIVGIALDLTNNKLYFAINGTWQNSANPATNSNGFSITAVGSGTPEGGYAFYGGDINTTGSRQATLSFNFGSPAFAISSGNADADGYGNFEYAVPSGYFALNTKNLAEYG